MTPVYRKVVVTRIAFLIFFSAPNNMGMSVSGIIGILTVIALVVGLAGWGAYAYRNPHSASGQMLIKVRGGGGGSVHLKLHESRVKRFPPRCYLCSRIIFLIIPSLTASVDFIKD